MGSYVQKRAGVFTNPGTNIVRMNREGCMTTMSCGKSGPVDKETPLKAGISFEGVDEDEDHVYQTLFGDHHEGEGIIIDLN